MPQRQVKKKCEDLIPQNQKKCFKATCEYKQDKGKYDCGMVPIDKPKDNYCFSDYHCVNNKWEATDVRDCREQTITEYMNSNGVSHDEAEQEVAVCKSFICDLSSKKCQSTDVEPCDPCPSLKENECTQAGKAFDRKVDECRVGSCYGPIDGEYRCSTIVDNCLTDAKLALTVQSLNEDNQCYTPVCKDDGCTYEEVPKPASSDNKCKTLSCKPKGDGSWSWEPVDVTCPPTGSSCLEVHCEPSSGCVTTDICRKDSTDCTEVKCDAKQNRCVSVDKPRRQTFCQEEECQPDEKGVPRLVMVDKKISSVSDECRILEESVEGNKCASVVCREAEHDCVTVVLDDEYYRKQHENDHSVVLDPCVLYNCNPDTGAFPVETPKCKDFDGCTVDNCNVFGKCNFNTRVNCYEEIDMTAYTCFIAVCNNMTEDGVEKHQCRRKLQDNAYIDICGNCIAADPEGGSTSGSGGGDTAVLDCADAPAKPLLQEGLAAASIALIILAAVVIGAGIAASGIAGTKTLMNRAKGANNQSAHSNPLFEDNDAEMSNPAYVGTE